MDYDDNDFESRNSQLVGEGSIEFPPVPRPYTLPKYDFDDSLREHLRFDNLVESEVFLGIESQEDNQWIEDFSQGSSEIEFPSNAAASCPISRHNNVWSEATSLESVEMLLKSVGQEEMIPGQTIIEELEACDKLGSSTKQIDPVSEQHDNIISSTKDIKDFGSTLPPYEILNSSSGLNEDSAGIMQVDDALHAFEGEAPGPDNSRSFDEEDVVESCSPVAKGNQLKDGKLDDANQREGACDEALDSRILEDSSTSQMQSDNLITSVQPTVIEDSNTEQATHQANHYSDADKVGMENNQDEDGKSHSLIKESQIDCQSMHEDINSGAYNMEEPLVVAHEIKSVEEINKVGTNLIDMDPSFSMTLKGNSDPQTLVGSSASTCPLISGQEYKSEVIGPTEDAHTDDHFKANMNESSPRALERHCHVEVNAGETDNYNSGIGANIEMQTHSYVQINDELCRISDRTENSEECGKQIDSRVSVSKSEASLFSMEDGKYFEVQSEQSNNSLMMETSTSKVVSTSAELETQVNLKLEGISDTLGVSGDDSNGEGQYSSSLLDKSKKCEENLVQGQDDVINCEQASDDSMKNTDCISNNTLDGCLMFTKNVACSLEAADPKDDGKSISVTEGPALNDKKEEVASKISVEAVLILNDGSQVVSGIGPVVKSGNDAYHGIAGDRNNEELDQSQVAEDRNNEELDQFQVAKDRNNEELDQSQVAEDRNNEELDQSQVAEESNIGNMSEAQNRVADKRVEDILIEKETHNVFCDSTVKEDLVAIEVLKSCDEEAAKEIYEETLLEVLDKPTCGSPTAISCVETCKQGRERGDTGHLEQGSKIDCSVSQDLKDNVSREQVDFSFDVRSLADEGDAAKGWHQSTSTEASKLTPIVERASSVSDLGHDSSMKMQELSHVSPQSNNGEIKLGGSRGTHERKARRTSGKATGKETAKRGNHVKLSTPSRQLGQVDKSNTVSPGPSLACQLVQSEGMQHTGHVEQCSKNTPNVLTTPTSSLPDLNTSAALIAVFQPSFTGSQQVQLRAQIFVYGSLIQGTAPEEACMISAFGDGGRGMWEKAWRVSLDRLQDQKCNPSNPETPLQQLSGTRSPDHANKQGIIQSNIISSPAAGKASSKNTSSPILNSTMPLSSPLWSIPTPGDSMQSPGIARSTTMALNQMPSPLHPYMTPSIRSFVGHSWVPQSPFAGPWVHSPQVSPFSSSVRFPPLSITEPVKSTPVRESSGPHASCSKHVFASPIFQIEGAYPGTSMTPDITKTTVSPVQDSANPKSRKRKKSSASEDLGLIYLPPQAGTYPSVSFGVASHLSSSVAMTTPMSKTTEGKFFPIAATTASYEPKMNNIDVEQIDVLSEETLNNVKEAKLQAENAATLATTAVNHSQVVWDELDKQKNSGMIAEREAKLASAAVAIAAAASVAKAAAAAAKVAAAAALQAKLMAEEAMFSSGVGGSSQNNTSLSNAVSILGDATPASILKGQDGMESSGSILIAAREAARSRVEAASAASRRAENLDAIVKAAELAAEAVTQAGKVVAMGNYLPLFELAEAGPKGYWKAPSGLALNSNKSKREPSSIQSVQHVPPISSQHAEDVSIEQKGTQTASSKKPPTPRELSRFSVEDHMKSVDGSSGEGHMKSVDGSSGEGHEIGQKGSKASVIAETVVAIPEPNIESRNSSISVQEQEKTVEVFSGKTIKVGSLVEVFKDVDSSKAAWCLASVLSLKGGEAYVCYTETPSGEGQLKEWVSLNTEGDNAPRIRFPHPMTTIQFEGSKKRSREAMVNYTWSVGDKVDACIDDCWCEGIVTEKNKKDVTTLTVHFPAQGKTSIVRAWKLRPSLLWKEGQWIEWSNLKENNLVSHEGDTPREKRRKIGSLTVESKEKEVVSADINVVESAVTEGTLLLDLRANEKIFNIGKNTKDESSKPEPLRTVRSGLQKEGSKKVFGIPKPVKKRKFMEVSKHYIADKSTNKTSVGKTKSVGNNQVKLAKVPIPQESGIGGWRNTKIDFRDRIPAESTKLRAFKTGKTQSVSASQDGIVMDRRTNLKGSASLNENALGKQSRAEFGSFSKNEGPADGPNLLSSLPALPDVSSRKVSTSSSKIERLSKGKLTPSAGKLVKIQEDKVYNGNAGKSITDGAVEPRRSNRRIQPTSRMLEGLQSSLSTSNYKPHNKSLFFKKE